MEAERKKRPYYPWYPGDWRRDTAVQACPPLTRLIWREMLDIMHDGEPYGHLTAGGKAIDPVELAGMIPRVTATQVREALADLGARNVYSVTQEGVLYSRRMVRDEVLRNERAAGGRESNGPTGKEKRTGGPGRLYNRLLERFGGCLGCGHKNHLELHRVVPGRQGGKYEPGNVLLLCGNCHPAVADGSMSVESVLARVSAPTLTSLFEGIDKGIQEGIDEGADEPRARDRACRAANANAVRTRFDEFWSHYPRKVGKAGAKRIFDRLHVSDVLLEIMLAALAVQRASHDWQKDGGQFIPHPATWLNQGRWEDEPTQAPTQRTWRDDCQGAHGGACLSHQAHEQRCIQDEKARMLAARGAA